MEFADIGPLLEEGMHGRAQGADALAVDDADAKDVPIATGIEVIVDHGFDVARAKCVKIENPVDRKFQRFEGEIGWRIHDGDRLSDIPEGFGPGSRSF